MQVLLPAMKKEENAQLMKSEKTPPPSLVQDHYTTLEVASMLGLAVRSVQLMVDRNELEAWKTPGGHRRISRASVEQWINARTGAGGKASSQPAGSGDRAAGAGAPARGRGAPQILLIEDSIHFQNLVTLLVNQHFPDAALHTASDGISGLAMYGQIQPDILIVDILLPGIMMSSSTMSGQISRHSANPASPVEASWISKSSNSSVIFNNLRMSAWSSTIRIFFMARP